jgi:2,4-dienoyl-CoA reductase-like NADH-dependent reductase (Old Yellow Enzyme family)
MPSLFEPLKIRDLVLKNRIAVSPMCQYSCIEGKMTDWHLIHLGSRAVGGAGLVICEATAVQAIGRISPDDAGLWDDAQIPNISRVTNFIKSQNAVAGIQLAHAGRKASTYSPWKKPRAPGSTDTVSMNDGGWQAIGPSTKPFSSTYPVPKEMSETDISLVIEDFKKASVRALTSGFEWLEIHAAHGYLFHSFLSPLSNFRIDRYGGSLENRIRFLMETVKAVRQVWPEKFPLAVRISATDWVEGGWSIDDSVELAKCLALDGVDLIDCSSGGTVPDAKIPVGPGYQVQFSEKIKSNVKILTGAVGMITEAKQADEIIRSGQADIVLLARELLRDPYWPLHAARTLGAEIKAPVQYGRAFS